MPLIMTPLILSRSGTILGKQCWQCFVGGDLALTLNRKTAEWSSDEVEELFGKDDHHTGAAIAFILTMMSSIQRDTKYTLRKS